MSASGGRGGWELVTRFNELFGSLNKVVVGAIGGFIGAIGVGVSQIGIEATELISLPLNALGEGSANIVTSFLGGIANIIQQSAVTAQQSLLPGATWAIGPLTFAIGVAAGGAGLYTLAFILGAAPTSNLLPGTFTDLPFIGVDEEEES